MKNKDNLSKSHPRPVTKCPLKENLMYLSLKGGKVKRVFSKTSHRCRRVTRHHASSHQSLLDILKAQIRRKDVDFLYCCRRKLMSTIFVGGSSTSVSGFQKLFRHSASTVLWSSTFWLATNFFSSRRFSFLWVTLLSCSSRWWRHCLSMTCTFDRTKFLGFAAGSVWRIWGGPRWDNEYIQSLDDRQMGGRSNK